MTMLVKRRALQHFFLQTLCFRMSFRHIVIIGLCVTLCSNSSDGHQKRATEPCPRGLTLSLGDCFLHTNVAPACSAMGIMFVINAHSKVTDSALFHNVIQRITEITKELLIADTTLLQVKKINVTMEMVNDGPTWDLQTKGEDINYSFDFKMLEGGLSVECRITIL
ncbi:uncharacterized protein LOC132724928 [Ruditapes philippinarum]|uniref:uncharacterized protein LOC132724928 n=1 Tax=Ruditapes philippinarum TaxID=129788 RepID=UPI00295B93BE|nr:uncharacterized protein LOC132724928 [Ruditapes philippinarum]